MPLWGHRGVSRPQRRFEGGGEPRIASIPTLRATPLGSILSRLTPCSPTRHTKRSTNDYHSQLDDSAGYVRFGRYVDKEQYETGAEQLFT